MPKDSLESHLPLKPLTYSILLALSDRDDYGYGIAKRVAGRDGGRIRIAPSNLYHVLDRLRVAGLVEDSDRRDPEDVRRTYYRLTPLGRDVCAAETARLEALLGTARALRADRGSR